MVKSHRGGGGQNNGTGRPQLVCLQSQTTESLIDQTAPDGRPPARPTLMRNVIPPAPHAILGGKSRPFSICGEIERRPRGASPSNATEDGKKFFLFHS